MKADPELENLLEEINASVGGEIITSPPPNPFVGLRPFKTEEDVLFFGRREQTIELLQMLHEPRFLAVVGSSGSGKSSLIQAGLIPKLKAGFLVEDRDEWAIATMRPGESPLYNLVVALLTGYGQEVSDDNVNSLSNSIRAMGVQGIVERFVPLFPRNDVNLLLLVDQFEEIFPFAGYSDGGERQADPAELMKRRDEASNFVALMLELSKQRRLHVYVVMTMRSDFLGDCDIFDELPKAMNRRQYLVARLTRPQQQEAIENPILLCGESIAPRLLDRVLNDLGEEPIGKEGEWTGDQMPIMQHALMRTWNQWEKRRSGPIDLEHYEAAGTISDALDKDADEALKETGEPILTKRIFQLLTNKDEQGRRTRRRARLSEIEKVTKTSREQIMDIIECFRKENRSFVTLSPYKTKDDLLVDISHESLIRQWTKLRKWVDEEAESRNTYLGIADAARGYGAETKTKGLLRNPELELALTWRKDNNPTEAWANRYDSKFQEAMTFLDKSRRRRLLLLGLYCCLALIVAVTAIGGTFVEARNRNAAARNRAVEENLRLQSEKLDAERKLQDEEIRGQREAIEQASKLQALIEARQQDAAKHEKDLADRQAKLDKTKAELDRKQIEVNQKEKDVKSREKQYTIFQSENQKLGLDLAECKTTSERQAELLKKCPN